MVLGSFIMKLDSFKQRKEQRGSQAIWKTFSVEGSEEKDFSNMNRGRLNSRGNPYGASQALMKKLILISVLLLSNVWAITDYKPR